MVALLPCLSKADDSIKRQGQAQQSRRLVQVAATLMVQAVAITNHFLFYPPPIMFIQLQDPHALATLTLSQGLDFFQHLSTVYFLKIKRHSQFNEPFLINAPLSYYFAAIFKVMANQSTRTYVNDGGSVDEGSASDDSM